MNEPTLAVALAILHREGQFLMQLRDDIPDILYPGQWALFGGHLERGETPEVGLKRELLEEINYAVSAPRLFRCDRHQKVIRYVFHAHLTVPLRELVLGEGWDLALVPTAAIRQGSYYSARAAQTRPMGAIHRQILLDFLAAEVYWKVREN